MGYCTPKQQKYIQIYHKLNNKNIPEIHEKQKKIKQDYESVKNQVMESNTKVVDIQDTKQKKKYNVA